MSREEIAQELNEVSRPALVTGLLNHAIMLEHMKNNSDEPIEFDSLKLSDAERRKRFGTRIKLLRQALGLKQADLAAKLNISPQALAIYETGRREPNLKNLILLSRVLGVPADWLLGEQ